MAKLTYNKPSFTFYAIPLTGNTATGCAYLSTQNMFVCPVLDDDLGGYIFSSTSTCDYLTDGGNVCYNVPIADYNVYNS